MKIEFSLKLKLQDFHRNMFHVQGPADVGEEAGGKGAEQVAAEVARADDEAGGGRPEEERGEGGGGDVGVEDGDGDGGDDEEANKLNAVKHNDFNCHLVKVDDLSLMLKRDGDATIPRRS